MKTVNNAQIAETFENIAGLLEMKGEKVFTIRAYQRVARTIEGLPVELEQVVREGADLKVIPGIGQAISDKITQLVETGEMDFYERLRSEFPDTILEVMHVPGLGPKTTKRLWDELNITTVAGLEKGIEDGSVARLPRLGEKKAQAILKELVASRSKDDRVPIGRARPAADRVIATLTEQCPSIHRLEAAGSLRRYEETIGDIDLVCTAGDHEQVLQAFVDMPNVANVLGHGGTKASVVLSEGIQVDLRVVDDSQLGALLLYSTGNQQHNIRLREIAVKMGLSLNEYGLKDVETEEREEFEGEEGLYNRLGLQYVPPELRQGLTEIARARDNDIPELVELDDLRGDLHMHTDWSDGEDPMELMIAAAKDRGYDYIAITDHCAGRGVANGLKEDRLVKHNEELREIEKRIGGIKVLAGSEVDIRAAGTLDYSDEVLAELDWVVASVHSAMSQESDVMTDRIIRAMHSPHVDAIGHLSTRRIGARKPIEADFEAIFHAAAETGTALEINAAPARLDLKDVHIMRARELGVPLVISSDAHRVDRLDNQQYGVGIARRGWCEPAHILNTLPVTDFLNYLSLDKSERVKAFAA